MNTHALSLLMGTSTILTISLTSMHYFLETEQRQRTDSTDIDLPVLKQYKHRLTSVVTVKPFGLTRVVTAQIWTYQCKYNAGMVSSVVTVQICAFQC